jgi:hypothetical protein
MAKLVGAGLEKRPSTLRMAGLRLVEIWVPDTRQPGFAAKCKRQSKLVSQADRADPDMLGFMDAALSDIDNLR